MTDSLHDRHFDLETNKIDVDDFTPKTISRKKRDTAEHVGLNEHNTTSSDKASSKSDTDQEMDYTDMDTESELDDEESDVEESQDDIERGKRQIRYFLQKGFKNPKNWGNTKPIKLVDFQQFNNYNPNVQNVRYQETNFNGNKNNYQEGTRTPYSSDNNLYSTANPFVSYQQQNSQSERPFKASLRDPFSQRLPHAPMNVATQIITKSPPISALKNNENPFSALAGGFYNNVQVQNIGNNQQQNQNIGQLQSQSVSPLTHQNNHVKFPDSSLLPTTVVTRKPVKMVTSPRTRSKLRVNPAQNGGSQTQNDYNTNNNIKTQVVNKPHKKDQEYDDDEEDDESSEEDSSEKDDQYYKHDFPEPPYEFTHPSNKYANIENPFANPNFDFDSFLAKLRDDHYSTVGVTTSKSKNIINQNFVSTSTNPYVETTTVANHNSGVRSSTLNYKGMSTPRPFSVLSGPDEETNPDQNEYYSDNSEQPGKFQQFVQQSQSNQHNFVQHNQQHSHNEPIYYNRPSQQIEQNAGIPLDAVRPKLKPPNFKDDRQLPISYSFGRPLVSTIKPYYDKIKGEHHQIFTVTQKPYVIVTGTGSPVIVSTPKQQYLVKPDKIIALQPHLVATGKPYLISSVKPHNAYISFKQSTQKPLTTHANEQLSALQHYWKNPVTESQFYVSSSPRPNTVSDVPKLENLFGQAIRSTTKTPNNNNANISREPITTTTKAPAKRRPIPKPSPEMNDYYYEDDEEQYYYEPPVKSKYMPSTEVKPQRPQMAQNYQEYDDFEDSEESSGNTKPFQTTFRRPVKYNKNKSEPVTKNHNDVSVVTKTPLKHNTNKFINGKIPVLVDYGTPAPNVLTRPEISNYAIVHRPSRNRTMHIRKPNPSDNGPFTKKPPKYLNQTTLRPYTVRHRLAKPTTVKEPTNHNDDSQTRGRVRHQNIVAHMKHTTPRDSHNQETRFTKTKHDDKTNR